MVQALVITAWFLFVYAVSGPHTKTVPVEQETKEKNND